MLLSDVSVKRPVFATVINLLLIIFGIVAISMLSLREYPDIDPPIVSVSTNYTGASANIVETRITQLLEDRISGIEGIKNITSTSRNGRSDITIEFKLSRDIDAAANDVRERVSRALNNLPDQADPPEVSKANSDESAVVWYNLRSTNLNTMELTDYAERFLVDRLSIVDGVARVQIGGGRRYAMKVFLDRNAMAARGITVTDVENVIRAENVELPAGEVESLDRNFEVRVARSFLTPDDFAALTVAMGDDGYLVRLGEIARVELAAEDDETEFRGDGVNMIGLGIIKQSKSNTLEVARAAKAQIARIEETLPDNIFIVPSYDSSVFIEASIDEVYETLAIAMLMVVVVIYLFLGNIRATLIPAVTVPVSLVAAFIVMYGLDFSINLLTLLAMVLAIGLVVDDAIVVLENIYRRIELGEPPLLAAYRGAKEVGFAVIATTLVLISVFVPLVFLEGNIGRLFTEFALAIAAAVAFSSFTALTLSPMMASKLLKKKTRSSGFGVWMDKRFGQLETRYYQSLGKTLHQPLLMVLLLIISVLAIVQLSEKVPSEFVPKEDRGNFFILMNAQEGASFESNAANLARIEEVLMPYRESGKIQRLLVRTPGFGGNAGMAIIGSADWDERDFSTFALMDEISEKLTAVPDVRAFAIMRSGISGGGFGRPVQFVLQGDTYENLVAWRDTVLTKAADNPNLVRIDSDYKETSPQLLINIDRDRAADLGVSISDIGRTLEVMLGQRTVSTFLDRGEEYDVIIEGIEADYRSPSSIDNLYVRSARTGELIPMDNLLTFTEQATSAQLNRYNRMRAVTISANLADGYTLGEALSYLENIVATELPDNVSIDYKGESQLYHEAGSSFVYVFILALAVTYLILAAQFESWIHPLVIMLTVPLALVGAFIGLYFAGMTLNIYSQIGLVMLIGLAAKNGILIVEFANQLRDAGLAFEEALKRAAMQRLRPIVMTGFTTVFSALPLVMASGPGAESRKVIGMVIFAGVLVSAFMTLYVVPTAYSWLARNTGSPLQRTHEIARLDAKLPYIKGE
ncbi:multidrug transporter AcrB [Alteromonas australica]|jgi:multidrug efflux pump|uniref:efflux RND transporter permease subunit n=1 Tax=Alteromonas TaxID=226 RepID=UPI0005C3F372|nr:MULTISPECIES: efflux RND transporter permease subunit [Alteromonas]MAB93899.1 AcrB/AcrD/AcrF family protein [Alteromonas sp.]AJP42899.1 multidrug transporter AcrB [Alteromonas australica]MAO31723.1 AcrB/AcrD/AcrF family protein [Alteromonas sp.]QPL49464.1 efflux RND transporter permease subunit [Alteromonas sp. B31-7]HBF71145.1 AcrB/AcrD/AcrF family protein [Alteromonas australica]|tara:strand:- start:6486 stop:9590 length:3105 start_codon:yes stop_codon:yes gene_type:complete